MPNSPTTAPERVPTPTWSRATTAAWFLIGLGLLPRLSHFLSGRALWFDEAALCINVLERGFGGLAQPLDFMQIAPLFYLWFMKLATLAFGASVYAVRLPSLLGGIAGLVLFWLVAKRVLSPRGSLMALALAACSQHLIYYAGEAKPYAVDVAVFLAVALVALELERRRDSGRFLGVAALVLGGLVWLSYPAVFAIAGIGIVQLAAIAWRRDWARLLHVAVPYAASACSFLLLFVLVMQPSRADTATMEYMNFYWRHGFMPFPPTSFWAYRWYRERTFMFFDMPGGFTLQGLALFCWLAGVVALGARKPWHAAALVSPLLLALAASSLKLYPFHGRMTLFLAPVIFLFIGEGIASLLAPRLGRARYAMGLVLVALLCTQPLVRAARMAVAPARHHELEVVLAAVEEAWQPGDRLFFRQGDYISYQFLKDRFNFPVEAIEVESRQAGLEGEEEAFMAGLESRYPAWGRIWFPMAYDNEATVAPYVSALQAHGATFARYTARGAAAYGIDFSAPAPTSTPGPGAPQADRN